VQDNLTHYIHPHIQTSCFAAVARLSSSIFMFSHIYHRFLCQTKLHIMAAPNFARATSNREALHFRTVTLLFRRPLKHNTPQPSLHSISINSSECWLHLSTVARRRNCSLHPETHHRENHALCMSDRTQQEILFST
jgi:hypothetical protein